MRFDMSLLAPTGKVVNSLRESFPNTLGVYAFGSQVQGHGSPQSDLDLAVLVGGYADPQRLWETASLLADVVGCHVDLLDLRAASTVMQHQVITTGKRLWAGDVRAGLFECYVLSEKTDFDAARKPLLQDIAATGKIYAG